MGSIDTPYNSSNIERATLTKFCTPEPTTDELLTVEAELEADSMTRQFPPEQYAAFDMGRGQTAPADVTYGRPTIVGRVVRVNGGGPVSRSEAKDILDGRGTRYEKLFYTARYWVAVVYS